MGDSPNEVGFTVSGGPTPSSLDVTVEPVLAATRLPDVPLDQGVRRPEGTVLLLHTTAAGDSVAQIEQRLAPLHAGPVAGRKLGHVRGLTSIADENTAQATQNPEGHRYLADCTWTNAAAAEITPSLQRMWR